MLTCYSLFVREYVPSENRKGHCFPVQLTVAFMAILFMWVIKTHKGRNCFDLEVLLHTAPGGTVLF